MDVLRTGRLVHLDADELRAKCLDVLRGFAIIILWNGIRDYLSDYLGVCLSFVDHRK